MQARHSSTALFSLPFWDFQLISDLLHAKNDVIGPTTLLL